MLLTDRFCYIHMPKTGGTFVTAALLRLHGVPESPIGRQLHRLAAWLGMSSRRRRYGKVLDIAPTHGTCHDIPNSHAHKPILSCIRGPYEWYVSQFEFGWWKRTFKYHPDEQPTPAGWAIEKVLPSFMSSHSDFPHITFSDFMQLCRAAAQEYNKKSGTNFGLYTHSFVRFFYRNPEDVLRRLSSVAAADEYETDRFNVLFLRTEFLNGDLVAALATYGYRREDLSFIETMDKVLPMGIGRREDQRWRNYYTPELAASVRENDDPLFKMFSFYDVDVGQIGPLASELQLQRRHLSFD
jgi:hypothetical protein